ncbi:MAG: thiamine pyrophosphate-dependent enzyme [Candidatus Bipolaricaulia bacterium]
MKDKATKNEELFAPGHRACPGCGEAILCRLVLRTTGRNVIVVSPTGCIETFTSPYLYSSWRVPWIHPLFENAPAVASGIAATLKAKGLDREVKVVVIAGDGATFDISMGALSGMFERGDNVTYVCADNEAYANTGFQRSGATSWRASTTTEPAGKISLGKSRPKKDLPAIAAAHGIAYVATASIAYARDLSQKVKKALATPGAKYIQVSAPCCAGWGFAPKLTVDVGRLGVRCGLIPLYEVEAGQVTKVLKIKKRIPVEDYLKLQKRFSHLFQTDEGRGEIARIQQIADQNIERLGLI